MLCDYVLLLQKALLEEKRRNRKSYAGESTREQSALDVAVTPELKQSRKNSAPEKLESKSTVEVETEPASLDSVSDTHGSQPEEAATDLTSPTGSTSPSLSSSSPNSSRRSGSFLRLSNSPGDSPLRTRLRDNVVTQKKRISHKLSSFASIRPKSTEPVVQRVRSGTQIARMDVENEEFGKGLRASAGSPAPESQHDTDNEQETDPVLRQRKLVIHEIISTEQQYVDDLTLMINYFLEPLRWDKSVPRDALQIIFGNIEVIHQIAQDLLKDFLARQKEKGDDILVGDIFLKLVRLFTLMPEGTDDLIHSNCLLCDV